MISEAEVIQQEANEETKYVAKLRREAISKGFIWVNT